MPTKKQLINKLVGKKLKRGSLKILHKEDLEQLLNDKRRK